MVRRKGMGGNKTPAPSAVAASAEEALRAAFRHVGDAARGGSGRPRRAPSAKAERPFRGERQPHAGQGGKPVRRGSACGFAANSVEGMLEIRRCEGLAGPPAARDCGAGAGMGRPSWIGQRPNAISG